MATGRRVIVLHGPPGAGKSTHAATLGLPVLDLDEFDGTAQDFRAAVARLASDHEARAVVIHCDPFDGFAALCGATERLVIDTPLRECIRRIRRRGRSDPPLRHQIAAATNWWRTYRERGMRVPPTGGPRRREL